MVPGAKPRKVACPICSKAAEFSPANPWRPFCSERCKLIDLGQWASESYRIAVEEPDEGASEDSRDSPTVQEARESAASYPAP